MTANAFLGKGMFIWKIRNCEDGDIPAIVAKAQASNLDYVMIKIAEADYGYNYVDGVDLATPLVKALKNVGVLAYGWQYVYGFNPYGEAMAANRRMRETGCDGFVINAEIEYRDLLDNAAHARTYTSNLDFPHPKALSTFRRPDYHKKFPYNVFLEAVDVNMPQVYWVMSHNPAEQLDRCIAEYKNYIDRPIIPTGSAYKSSNHDWVASAEEVLEFAARVKELGIPGINFWEWANTTKYGLWPTIVEIDHPAPDAPGPGTGDCSDHLIRIAELEAEVAALQVLVSGNYDVAFNQGWNAGLDALVDPIKK